MQQQEAQKQQQAQAAQQQTGLTNALLGGGTGGAVASQLGGSSALAATPAANAAWNAGATAAGGGLGAPATPTLLGAKAVPASAGGIGLLPGLGIVAGVGLGGKAAYDMIKGKKPNTAGRVVLGMATGGLSEVANKFLNRKTTKEYQKEKWGNLAKASDAPTADYAKQYLNYLNSDRAKEDAKYENTFDGKKAAGKLAAEDVWGGEGIFKTFGSDWLGKYNENQRRDISQALIDNDLLGSSKGDITVKDANKAKEIASSIFGGVTPMGQAIQPVEKPVVDNPKFAALPIQKLTPMTQALTPQRSSTSSPGIGLDGKRINYSKR